VKSSIEYFHARHFNAAAPFEPAISRECAFPYKPSPAALLHICGAWGVPPSECLMVGDSAKVRLPAASMRLLRGCPAPTRRAAGPPRTLRRGACAGSPARVHLLQSSCRHLPASHPFRARTPLAAPPPPPPRLPQDDIVCGNRAGALTALLDITGASPPPPPGDEASPTHVVHSLSELRRLLEERYVLLPPAGEAAAAAAAAEAAAGAAAREAAAGSPGG
jgi:hypothetical protein